jgi:hypothetical protein
MSFVFGSTYQPRILSKADAIHAAQRWLLCCKTPGDGHPVRIVARDANGDGIDDHVATEGDDTVTNNLSRLPILELGSQTWLDPGGNPFSLSDSGVSRVVTRKP